MAKAKEEETTTQNTTPEETTTPEKQESKQKGVKFLRGWAGKYTKDVYVPAGQYFEVTSKEGLEYLKKIGVIK
jgi:hypothetical protein